MRILSIDATGGVFTEGTAWQRISSLGRLLENQGHKVHFVHYLKDRIPTGLLGSDTFQNHTFIPSTILSAPFKHTRFLLKGKYDLVFGNTHTGVIRGLLGKLLDVNIPLIFDIHGDIIAEEYMNHDNELDLKLFLTTSALKLGEKTSLLVSNHVTCVSRKMISYYHEKKHVPLKKMSYITNGVDLSFFKPRSPEQIDAMKRKLGLGNKMIFGYVGNFQKWQGVPILFDAIKKMHNSNSTFLFVGGKKDIKTEYAIAIPRVPRAMIPDYYAACDVLVLPRPSHQATEVAAPTKFGEYLAMGKPILTTNVGDAGVLVKENNCGIVVQDNTIASLINGINQFITKGKDDLSVMSKNARSLAEREFSWEKVEKALSIVIKQYL